MNSFFSNTYQGNRFSTFSDVHLITIAFFFIGCILLFLFRNKLTEHSKKTRVVLFSVLLFFEITYQSWLLFTGNWELSSSLPLQLCTISTYLCLILLITNRFQVFEIVFFTGIGGALQAILTPELFYNFPHFRFIQFFTSHALIIWICLFYVFSMKYRPTFKSIGKTFIFLNVLSFFVFFINKFTGGNYMFLAHKPTNASVIDYLGPYPWYIASLEALAFIMFFILFIPFLITNKVKLKNK